MAIKSTSHSACAVAIFTLFCALAPRLHLQNEGELQQADVEKIVANNPLGANDNIQARMIASKLPLLAREKA